MLEVQKNNAIIIGLLSKIKFHLNCVKLNLFKRLIIGVKKLDESMILVSSN